MRIVFLCKRRYMGKDVIDDRYARLYELPRQLALLGHDVLVLAAGYQGQSSGQWEHDAPPGRLRLHARNVRSMGGLLGYPSRMKREVREFGADLIVGASDIPQIVLAAHVARSARLPLAVDLYDNFESFGQARLPGMVWALRRAVRRASVVSTTSEALAEHVRHAYHGPGKVIAIPSSVDTTVFRRRDRAACRRALGLPADAILIGTAGGLHRSKGIGDLFGAWERLQDDRRLHLVIAGPRDGSVAIPRGDRVHDLGELRHPEVATLFSALDVATVCVLDTPFGRYCFPQKAYEILATGTPLVAADVGAMQGLLRAWPGLLYRSGSADSLAERIRDLVANPVAPDVPIEDWAALVKRIEPALRSAVLSRHPS